ncbi:MAG: glutamate--tRNA ligase, partial [Pseudopedobacter saltans]
MTKVRVRFAPSPTGALHLGGVRTALYDYLFAKNKGGEFVLRIEDTDTARYVEGAEDYIMNSLEWCGIIPDESPKVGGPYAPYRQSERRDIYDRYKDQILKTDYAYLAFDTPEELDAIRKDFETRGDVFSYNYHTRQQLRNSISLSSEEVQKLLDENVPY